MPDAAAGDFALASADQCSYYLASFLNSECSDSCPVVRRQLVENHQTCSKITIGIDFTGIAKRGYQLHTIENNMVRMARKSRVIWHRACIKYLQLVNHSFD